MATVAGVVDAMPSDAIAVARIVDAFGVRGWVKLDPYSDDAGALSAAKRWWLKCRDGADVAVDVLQVRPHGAAVVAQLDGVGDRSGAQALRLAEVWVPRSAFPQTAEGEFYWVDLVGCEVRTLADVRLGVVDGLMDNGAHAILEVGREGGVGAQSLEKVDVVLIPFVDAYVKSVDLAGRRIVVDWVLE